MKRLLREPLLHFLLIGAALFALHARVSAPGRDRTAILVTRGEVEQLANGFEKLWHRAPSPEEMVGLVRDRVKEEVYYREALAMGLDTDDAIIRRRLRQKLEFLSDDVAARSSPTDSALAAYLAANAERYRKSAALSFRQVYLNPDRHRAALARDAETLFAQLQALRSPDGASELGDATMLEHRFESVAVAELERQFGRAFTEAVGSLPTGSWRGPLESGYGMHFVLVTGRLPGATPSLTEVRDAVERDWMNERRLESSERAYREMLTRYTVRVEGVDSLDVLPAGLPR
jgi:hypothetical protein